MVTADPRLPLLDCLLLQYDDIFTEPTGLPPQRPYDHRIHLLPGTAPMVVRPYRYPQLQKDELERQCAEMLPRALFGPAPRHSPPRSSLFARRTTPGGSASTTAPLT